MMKRSYIYCQLLFLVILCLSLQAQARPEFAAKHGLNTCTACHQSPYGGGPKNTTGKLYFSRVKPMGQSVPPESFSLDFRMNGLFPKDPEKNRNGLAIMSTIGAVHIAIPTEEDWQTQFVGDYDFGMLGVGLRNSYLLLSRDSLNANPTIFGISHIQIGKTNIPFGLLTDEHWSYGRLQTRTTINDFDTGFGISGEPFEKVHYDFLVTNANTHGSSGSNGGFTDGTTTSETKHAFIGNFRWDGGDWPLILGGSGMAHSILSMPEDPYAISLYSVISIHRGTGGHVPLTLLFESVTARGWNSATGNTGIKNNFIPTGSNYYNLIADKQSVSYSGEIQWEVIDQYFTTAYKYETLTLDQNYSGDVFVKHNFSWKWYLTSRMNLLVRAENAQSRVPTIEKDTARGTKDYYYFIFHYWL